MSFDCMVFDATAAPATENEFRVWYEDEIADRNGAQSQDSATLDCDALRIFYNHLREVFTPFNGPDDVPLPDDVSQLRILRTCEYIFRPASIVMQFRWPAQDFARAACSTYALQLNLGFFHLSTKYPQARLPDKTYLYPYGSWKEEDSKGKPGS